MHNTVKIMDIDSGQELKYNEVGEIWISGPSIMLGYYKNPEATAEVLDEYLRMKRGRNGFVQEIWAV